MRTGRAAWIVVGWVVAATAGIGCREGQPPPYLRISGDAPSMQDLPNARAHLVTFWGSWCAPCVEETPSLKALARRPPPGLGVVVVSVGDEEAAIHTFFGGAPPPELHLRPDEDARLQEAFGVEQLPVSFLVVDGQKAARFDGRRDWDDRAMRRLLERLVDGR